MTSKKEIEGIISPEDILDIANRHMEAALSRLSDMADAAAANALNPAEAKTIVNDARRAIQTFFDERKRFEQISRNSGALVAGELDLDAARAEIGRRLARLRVAGDAGGVSE